MSESIGFADILTHNTENLSTSDPLNPWTGVRILWDGDEWDASVPELGEDPRIVKKGDQIGFAGDISGRVLEVRIAFGQMAVVDPAHLWDRGAENLLAAIQRDTYCPFDARNAVLDPAFEIGDTVTLPDGSLSVIYGLSGELDGVCAVDASAPPDNALDTAYPSGVTTGGAGSSGSSNISYSELTGILAKEYLELKGGLMRGPLQLSRSPSLDMEAVPKQYVDERINRFVEDVNGSVSAITQTTEELRQEVRNNSDEVSVISQTVDNISLSVSTVTENGEVFARLTLKIGDNDLYGYIKLEGNVDISGQLSAEALYSGYGEIADLSVNRFSTSRRIARYLRGDTSDDNFLRAYEQNLEWVTGSTTGETEQAQNPNGEALFWPVDVSGLSRGADGYPVNEHNERIFTTTTPTSYPVLVYRYQEAVKRSISFETINGIYSPVDRFGAGNQQGRNKAWMNKTANGFDIRYLTPDNKEIGIRMSDNGTVTIDGLVLDSEKAREILRPAYLGNGGSGGLDLTTINADGSASGLVVDTYGHTEILGMPKVTQVDFSRVNTPGYHRFVEALDNGLYNTYTIERDDSGRVTKITDLVGHETTIVW